MPSRALGDYVEFRRVPIEEATRLCKPEYGFKIDRVKSPAVEVAPGSSVCVMKVYVEDGEE